MTRKTAKTPQNRTPGRPLTRFLLWSALFLLLLAAVDQTLLRWTFDGPLMAELQDCYRDLRGRLLVGKKSSEDAIGVLLEQPAAPAKSYIYADSEGELHFVDSLQQVPSAYRGQAQPLEE